MKRSSIFALTLSLAVALSAQGASAQRHGNKHGNGHGKKNDDRGTVVIQQRAARSNAKAGPKFCQSGQGHPVHGRQWCVDHGFALGSRSRVVRTPRVVWLTQPQVVSLMPGGTWLRMERTARQRGFVGPYRGLQSYENGLRLVTLRAGNVGFAQVVLDQNGNFVRSYFIR
jgi:hypothetical protein